jgi:hypothetical protein
LLLLLSDIVLFENTVHTLGVEPEVAGNTANPGLVHTIKATFDDVSNFEVDDGVVFVEVDFNDVRDEEERELYFPGLSVLGEMRSNVFCVVDIVIETGVSDLPLHFLQSGPQKQSLQFIHHHYFDDLQHYFVERDPVHVRLFLPILAYLLEQYMCVIGELILYKPGVLLFVSFPIGCLGCPFWLHSYFHRVHHKNYIKTISIIKA